MSQSVISPDPGNEGSLWPQLRRFGSQSAIYTAGTVASRLAGFVLIPVYTDHIPSHDYGIIALLILVTQAVSAVAGLGLMNSMFRLWPRAKSIREQRRLHSTVIITQCVAAIVLFWFIWLNPRGWSEVLLGTRWWGHLLLLAVTTGLVDMISSTPLGALRMLERPRSFVAVNLTRSIVSMSVAVYLVAILDLGVFGVLWANLAGAMVAFLVVILLTARYLAITFDRELLREMLPFGLWYMVGVTAGLFWSMGDRYVLKYLLGLSAVGVYTLGHQLATSVNMLGQSFITAYLPMGLKHDRNVDGGRFVAKTYTYLAFALVWVALGFSLLSREIILLLARKPEYYQAWHVVPVLAFGFVLFALIGGMEIGFYFAGIAQYNTWIIICAFALNIGINFLLIPVFGIMGAAMSAMIVSAIRLVVSWYWAQRVYYLPYETRRIILLLSLAAVFHLGVLITGPVWTSAAMKVGIALLYPVVLWAFGFATVTERQAVHEVVALVFNRTKNGP